MLKATFLGWQGWHLASATTNILVDPLFQEAVGRGPEASRATFNLWPPRRANWSKLPAIDAVLITHEHEDHLDVRSLSAIARDVRLLLSSRSSMAARTVLAELGFRVELVAAGAEASIGNLVIRTFTADHSGRSSGDEWDAFGLAVTDVERRNVFFTNVDVPLTYEMREFLAGAASNGGGLCFVDFRLFASVATKPVTEAPDETSVAASEFVHSFDTAAQDIRLGIPRRPLPGQTFIVDDGSLQRIEQSGYLDCPATTTWPLRPGYWPLPSDHDGPTSDIDVDEQAELEIDTALEELARFIYGTKLFNILFSLSLTDLDGRDASFAWIMRVDTENCLAFWYSPEQCAFVPLDDINDAFRGIGVVTTWASDFLAVWRGDIEPRNVVRGFRENWSIPIRANIFFMEIFWMFFHPLRRPHQVLRRYRELCKQLRGAPIVVRSASRSTA